MEDRAWVTAPTTTGPGSRRPAGAGAGIGPEPLSETLARRLLEQRVVLLQGPLDDLSVTRVSALLMTLDAEGDEPVTLRVDCGEAGLGPALTLMDVIELMGVPVRALCLGQVGAGAIGVVAVCAQRAALPSTRFSLCEPTTQLEAHVRNVAQWAELRAGERHRFCERVAAAVGKPAARSRRTSSAAVSSARPRRSSTASSTRSAGPMPPSAACRAPAPSHRPSGSGRCADRAPGPASSTPCLAACSCSVYAAFRDYASFGRLLAPPDTHHPACPARGRPGPACVPTMRPWPHPDLAWHRSRPASGTSASSGCSSAPPAGRTSRCTSSRPWATPTPSCSAAGSASAGHCSPGGCRAGCASW